MSFLGSIGNIFNSVTGGLFGETTAQKAGSQALSTEGSVQSAALGYAEPTLQRAQSGQLSPSEQASVDQWKTSQEASWNNYLTEAGIGTSSSAVGIHGQINEQALAMGQQFLQQDISSALNALGISSGAAGGAADIAMAQQKEQQDALTSLFGGLGNLFSSAGGVGGISGMFGGGSAGVGGPAGLASLVGPQLPVAAGVL